MKVEQGDTIQVMSNKVGQPNQQGVVRRVIELDPLRIEVDWEDGHTSELVPAAGSARVVGRRS